MKALLPTAILSALAIFVVAQNPSGEQAPPDALTKIQAAIPDKAFAKPKKARTVLVFARTNGFRHGSIPTGKLAMTEIGKKTGAFETVISDDLENFEIVNLKKYDGVIFLNTTGNSFAPSKEENATLSEDDKKKAKERELRLKDNLMKFVKSGRAFIGIHSATDGFGDWPEYGQMINGYFDGHPWGAGTNVSIKVEPGQEKNPLTAMFEGQNIDFKEEIYQLKAPYDSKAVEMLLRLDPEKSDMNVQGLKREDKDFGVSWVRHWEKGRVFYCSLGHNNEMYWNPKVVRHYLAGIQWALGDFDVKISEGK